MRFPAAVIGRQIGAILGAWGMPEPLVRDSVEMLLAADLAGIDSHGLSMLPIYDDWRRQGKLVLASKITVVRDRPTTALLDGGGGLGHAVSKRAMLLAIEKAQASDIGIVTVRRSHHYGAAGVYALMAAEAGLIGMSATNVHTPSVVPLWGADTMFGTNPWAFAAPAKRNRPFLLDMATSTVAIGKLKLAWLAGKPIPEGWSIDDEGRALTEAEAALKHRRMTPLGVSKELGGHKGYGLAMMVEILSATLPGAQFAPMRIARDPAAKLPDVGHFFLAMNPEAFREKGEFERDMDDMIDTLRKSRPVDPEQPVLVPGDPEYAARAERERDGIPVPATLATLIQTLARNCNAEFLLG
jgi:LDH2 family malate/lactate/ureidoglycolate dehydrogenase